MAAAIFFIKYILGGNYGCLNLKCNPVLQPLLCCLRLLLVKAFSRKELSFGTVAPISNHTESIFSVVFEILRK
jgi:hypothetical protein